MSKSTLQDLRRQAADRIFEAIHFPSSVEDHEGWDSFQGGGFSSGSKEVKMLRAWHKVVYLLNEGGDTKRGVFSVVFHPNSPVVCEAYLDDKELVLP
jgi:hypothetical protein